MKISAFIFLALVLVIVVEGQDGAGTCFQRIKGPPRKVKWAVCNSKGKHSLFYLVPLVSVIYKITSCNWINYVNQN